MRKNEINKLRKRKLSEKYSDVELGSLVDEVKEYYNLMNSIGISKTEFTIVDVKCINKQKKRKPKKTFLGEI
jgi:hypothetical protein